MITIAKIKGDVFFRQTPAAFKKNFIRQSLGIASQIPSLSQVGSRYLQTRSVKVVKHDNIGASRYSLVGFRLTLNFHFYLQGEATNGPGCFNGFRNGSWLLETEEVAHL